MLYVHICIIEETYAPAYGLYVEGATEEEINEINSKLPEGMTLAYWDKQSHGCLQISSEENVYEDFEKLAFILITLDM